ncbi:RNA helicase [Malassezia yamatoensis]|uniref:RNA helicase n=1 Tax=Malassezia yamatoensis TaxID=253288 RepID=A0AAJ5YRV4_9BASI|nr:RNA helicase [Malassezia yamatoensis]
MPLSVKELVAQHSDATLKPRFVSKKDREAHREEAKLTEAQREAQRLEHAKRERLEWERKAANASTSTPSSQIPAKRVEAEDEQESLHETTAAAGLDTDALRQRYLGQRPNRARKVRRSADPSKRFLFEWDDTEDTSDAQQLAIAESIQSSVLANRGGLDTTEANKGHSRSHRSILNEKHWTDKELQEMKERDWRIFREDYGIAIKGGNIPPPLRSWQESQIPELVLDAIQAIGYKEPSAIQRQAIPIGLERRDLIGIAETGSGKTASFVIPMLAHVAKLPRLNEDNAQLGPYALIMSPTRELAQQIEAEALKLVSRLGIRVVSVVGGRDVSEQAYHLQRGAEIVIATPGRLKDLLEQRIVMLGQCHYLVLDEADRMVDMNYEAELDYILASLPQNTDSSSQRRVTMLYSATMPPYVEKIARSYLTKPATVLIGNAGQAVGTVEQQVEFVHSEEKRKARLLAVLDSGLPAPMIVFVNQKTTADMIGRDLRRAGWRVAILHSGLSQTQREAAIQSIRDGQNEVLCCTDIGARGIDLPNVSQVVNYQFPTNFPSYIHRIGRTGRAGKQGRAVTFVDDNDAEHLYALKQEIAKSPVSKVPMELARHPAAQNPSGAT